MQIGQEYASCDATQKFHHIIGLRPRCAPLPHSLSLIKKKQINKTKHTTTMKIQQMINMKLYEKTSLP